MESPSDLTYGKIQELRDALASKRLVLKDSIIARFAKIKSLSLDAGTCPSSAASQAGLKAANEVAGGTASDRQLASAVSFTLEGCGTVALKASLPTKIRKRQMASSSRREDMVLAVNISSLKSATEEDRKRRRAERFGTVTEDEKLRLRAERFGSITEVGKLKEDPKKLQARAARFGIVDEETKKRARLERFDNCEQDKNLVEQDKKLARIARFSSPNGKPLSIANKE